MKIEEFYIFNNLDDISLKMLKEKITKSKYKKNSIIFYKDDCSKKLHILVSGIAKIYKHSVSNDEITLNTFETQSLIGEMATFENIPYPANCIAESDVEIWTILRDDFLDILSKNPLMSLEIIASMSLKIRFLENSINLNISKNSTQRVAFLMLNNPDIFKKLTRIKIASTLNMTPETLSRIIKKFKDENLVRIDKKVLQVIDSETLRKLS